MSNSNEAGPERAKATAAWRYKKWPRVLLMAATLSSGVLLGGYIGHQGSVSQEHAANREVTARANTLQRCRDFLAGLVTSDQQHLVVRSTSLPQTAQYDCGVQNALHNRAADYEDLREIGWELPEGASVASAVEVIKVRMPSLHNLDGQISTMRDDAANFDSQDVAVRTIAAGAIGGIAGAFVGALGVVSILPPLEGSHRRGSPDDTEPAAV